MLGLVAVVACDRPPRAGGMTDDEFVSVMVSLRRLALTHANDPEAFQVARDELLVRAAVSDSMLHHFVAVHAQDPERLADVFAAIRDSLRSSPEEAIQ